MHDDLPPEAIGRAAERDGISPSESERVSPEGHGLAGPAAETIVGAEFAAFGAVDGTS